MNSQLAIRRSLLSSPTSIDHIRTSGAFDLTAMVRRQSTRLSLHPAMPSPLSVAELAGIVFAMGGSGVWRQGGGCSWCVSVGLIPAILTLQPTPLASQSQAPSSRSVAVGARASQALAPLALVTGKWGGVQLDNPYPARPPIEIETLPYCPYSRQKPANSGGSIVIRRVSQGNTIIRERIWPKGMAVAA